MPEISKDGNLRIIGKQRNHCGWKSSLLMFIFFWVKSICVTFFFLMERIRWHFLVDVITVLLPHNYAVGFPQHRGRGVLRELCWKVVTELYAALEAWHHVLCLTKRRLWGYFSTTEPPFICFPVLLCCSGDPTQDLEDIRQALSHQQHPRSTSWRGKFPEDSHL